MLSEVTLSTWPEQPSRIRCNRYYTLCDKQEVLIEGKNEWAMLEVSSERPRKIADAYPQELEHLEDTACDTPFSRPNDDFTSCEKIADFKVNSSNIDASRHMNNVEYLRAVFGLFSCAELEQIKISEVEVFYRAQCYENENLQIFKRFTDTGMEIGIVKENGKTACIVVIKF